MTVSSTPSAPFDFNFRPLLAKSGLRNRRRETLPSCWIKSSTAPFDYSPDSDRPSSEPTTKMETLWTPQPGPQTTAYESEADEILYGGEPGGGKTSWLLGHAIMKHTRSHIFRRDAGQLGEMTDDLRNIVGDTGRVTESPRPLWRHGDKRIEMAGIANEADAFKWQGRAGDFKAFDEITQFSKNQYLTVSGWGRSTTTGQKVQTAGTCNPPVDEDALWVVERWGPWLDPNHPNPAASGEIRWFATIGGEDTECEDGEPFDLDGEMIHPSSRTFIRARLDDNAYLGADYRRKLDALPEPMRTIFKTSDFMALLQTNHPMQVIPTSWIRAAQQRWSPGRPELPGTQRLVPLSCIALDVAEGGKDRTVKAKRYGDWITIESKPGIQTPRAEDAAAFVEPDMLEGGYVLIDADGVGGQAYGILWEKFKRRARPFRGVKPTLWRDSGGTNEFFNCVTGDARIAPIGQALRIYKSRYDGPLYRIKTAGGDAFTVTANHNVLTPRGWVAVHTIGVGDQLLDTGLGQRAVGRDPEEQYMPPPIGKVYRAARACFGAQRVADGAVNFHGDRPVGEVEVVTLDGLLWHPAPSLGKHGEYADFVGHLLRAREFSGEGGAALPFRISDLDSRAFDPLTQGYSPDIATMLAGAWSKALSHQTVSGGISSQRNTALLEYPDDRSFAYVKSASESFYGLPSAVASLNGPIVQGEAVVSRSVGTRPQSNGFPLASWTDSVFLQGASYDPPVDPITLSERVSGLAGQIPTDEIIRIDILSNDHDGGSFVYTLETTTGAYSSQSIAHRNCRAAAWWCAREALDPTNPRKVALPPGADLLAELAAPRWFPSGQKIQLEKKSDIIPRLGRSPDLADAVVMALWSGSASDVAESFEIKVA